MSGERSNLVFDLLTNDLTESVISAAREGAYYLQTCIESLLRNQEWHTTDMDDAQMDIQTAILIDYYVTAIWWAVREANVCPKQISAFFTVVFDFYNGIKDGWTIDMALIELKKLSIGVQPSGHFEPLPSDAIAGGFKDLYNLDETNRIIDYLNTSVIQHFRLYQCFHGNEMNEDVISEELSMELLDTNPLPPLCDAITERQYKLLTEDLTDNAAASDTHVTGEEDILSKLSPDVICQIIHSVFDEIMPVFQDEVDEVLRKKADDLIQRINKLHVAK